MTFLVFLFFSSRLFTNSSGVSYRDQAKKFLKESGKTDDEVKSVIGATVDEVIAKKKTEKEEYDELKLEVKALREEVEILKGKVGQ